MESLILSDDKSVFLTKQTDVNFSLDIHENHGFLKHDSGWT
jgi:hypothetical protein